MSKTKILLEDIMNDFLIGCCKLYSRNFILKGCMALKYYLNTSTFRGTSDIDFSVKDTESWEVYLAKCCDVATKNSKINAKYSLIKRRGFSKNPNSDSATFLAVVDNTEYKFKVDMNIKPSDLSMTRNSLKELKIFSIDGILQDKINVAVTRKLCRRIKDLIDLYYISLNSDFSLLDILKKLNFNKITENYLQNPEAYKELEHAYDKYSNKGKKEFNEVYHRVNRFIEPIADCIIHEKIINKRWSKKKGYWIWTQ